MTGPEFWTIATQVCTPRQLEALRWKAAGYGDRRIARFMGISKTRVGELLDTAEQKIKRQKEAA